MLTYTDKMANTQCEWTLTAQKYALYFKFPIITH